MAVCQLNWNLSVIPSTSFSNVCGNVQLNRLLEGDRRTYGEGKPREDEPACPTSVRKTGNHGLLKCPRGHRI